MWRKPEPNTFETQSTPKKANTEKEKKKKKNGKKEGGHRYYFRSEVIATTYQSKNYGHFPIYN